MTSANLSVGWEAELSVGEAVLPLVLGVGSGGAGVVEVDLDLVAPAPSIMSLYGFLRVVSTPGKLEPRELCW